MTPDKFRRLALDCQGTSEQEHMRYPDFRVAGKIFATLGYPDENWGMVKLTPEQQQSFVAKALVVGASMLSLVNKPARTKIWISPSSKKMFQGCVNCCTSRGIGK